MFLAYQRFSCLIFSYLKNIHKASKYLLSKQTSAVNKYDLYKKDIPWKNSWKQIQAYRFNKFSLQWRCFLRIALKIELISKTFVHFLSILFSLSTYKPFHWVFHWSRFEITSNFWRINLKIWRDFKTDFNVHVMYVLKFSKLQFCNSPCLTCWPQWRWFLSIALKIDLLSKTFILLLSLQSLLIFY